jgi:hypothetical protein
LTYSSFFSRKGAYLLIPYQVEKEEIRMSKDKGRKEVKKPKKVVTK